MTREEAIAYFRRHIELYCVDGISREAEEMAIKALEQEPCEDAVSRQAVLEEIPVLWNGKGDKDYCMETLRDFVTELPPVIPTHTETVTEFADRCRECGKQKKGKWERGYSFPDGEYAKCTVCGEIIKCIYPMHYCPNCGAEMESE